VEKEKDPRRRAHDFILSAEIIRDLAGTVAGASFGKQVVVLAGIAVIMTDGRLRSRAGS